MIGYAMARAALIDKESMRIGFSRFEMVRDREIDSKEDNSR